VGLKKGKDHVQLIIDLGNGEEEIIRIILPENRRNGSNAWIGVEASKDKVKIKRMSNAYLINKDDNGDINGNK
jgi:hypothetical protein